MKNILLFFLLLAPVVSFTQETSENVIEQFIAEMLEEYSAESDEEPDAENWYGELMSLASHPLTMNTAEKDDLSLLPFLSELQVENILYHRYTYGAFTTLYELQLVEGLDMTDIRRMLPFVTLGEAINDSEPLRWWEVKKFGRHEVYLRTDFIPELKKGYQPMNDEPAAYAGDRMYSHLKYRFDFRDRIRLNLTLEKDAGERWWTQQTGGIDFGSASLQVRSVGPFDNLIVGDFTAGFGQGLVIQQGFNRSKSAMATRVFTTGNGFKRFASTNEYAFFRGVAASVYRGRFGIHSFLSNRRQDATLEEDVFRSFYTTGYHRTAGEEEKRNRIVQQTAGVACTYRRKNYELGLTSVYTRFSSLLSPELKPYNRYYVRGRGQLTSGFNYRINLYGIQFFGETALVDSETGSGETTQMSAPKNEGVASVQIGTLNGFTFTPSSRVSVAMVHRYYPVAFNPFFATSFSAQSRIGNEHGMYLGMEVLPARRWKIAAYADSYRFAWLKYGVDAPSWGNDFLLQLDYSPTRRMQLSMRNRYKQQYASLRSESSSVTGIGNEKKWSSRLQLDYTAGVVQLRSVVELNHFRQTGRATTGYAAWQDVSTPVPGLPLKISLRYLMFQIPDYANRIYTYEKDVLHAFSSPSFSGIGSRYYLMAHYVVNRRIACWLKLAQVKYSDGRTTTGSGNEEIAGSKRTEFHFLMRLQLRNQ
ncbi:MAG: helix-hairpin-helix domain-containing protein [Paludibacter sp.]|jgi:hypothetical protein|nr:helix-hairpin-helix domain-containing protein [Paludibacter sp.]